MLEGHQSYKCRVCNDEIEVLQQECGHCGLTSGRYRRSPADDKITLHCTSCDAAIRPLPPPDMCNAGHRGDCGWCDTRTGAWIEPDLRTNDTGSKAVWVRGNFQGVYTGELTAVHMTFAKEDQRSYTIDFFQMARLDDLQRVDGPPDKSPGGQKPPILAPVVTAVIASTQDTATGKRSEYGVSLHDFRLHEWRDISGGEIASFFGKTATGRLSGVAYAFLKPDALTVPDSRKDAAPKKSLTAETPPVTSPTGDPTDNGQSPVPPQNSGYVLGKLDKTTIGTAEVNVDSQGDIPARGVGVRAMHPETVNTVCFSCSFWLQLALGIVVWYCCGWQHALVFIVVSQAACWLADICARHGWIVRAITPRNLLIALIALLVTVGVLIEAYSLALSDDCALISDWPIYLIATAFALTALIAFCWLRFILLAAWFLSMLLWCSANGLYCDHKENTNRLDRFLDEIDIHFDTVINPDVISDIVNDATVDPDNPDNNRKISIDEITKDPELLDKCGNSVYFPEVALFAKGSPNIEPRAHAQLRKLIPLLKARPDKKIIITGHADKSGDETDLGYLNNIALSDQRAAAVAQWLITHHAIDASRIDVRGAGTSLPLTLDPERAEYNRRVEVEINCPNPNQRTKN
jgi:outer membrane protein OmpA-like peptidoglycan-associated protein